MQQVPFTVQAGHIFKQSPQIVFDHWLAELHQGKWLFATANGRMQGATYRAAAGDSFIVTQGRNVQRGQWLNRQRPQVLFFSFVPMASLNGWREPDLVQLNFIRHPLGCELKLSHQTCAQWQPVAHQLIEGWTHVFASLAAELNDTRLPIGQLIR